MKETAVEWLVHELDKQMIERDKFDAFDWIFQDLIKQAKAMEKQQIVEAHGNKQKTKSDPDSIVTYGYTFTGEAYYNKTYKNTEQ
jgi:hypothetical protein